MSMQRYELENVIGRMVDLMGAEEVLMELTRAMSTDELEDNLEFISRMNDLGVMGDDEE